MSDIKLFQTNSCKVTELESKYGNLAVLFKSAEDLEKSKLYILKSYEMS